MNPGTRGPRPRRFESHPDHSLEIAISW